MSYSIFILLIVITFAVIATVVIVPNIFSSVDQDAQSNNIQNSSVNASYNAGTTVTKEVVTNGQNIILWILILAIITVGLITALVYVGYI